MRAIATSCYVSSKSLGSHITKGTYNEHFSYIKKGQKHAKKRCGFSSSLTRIFAFSLRRCSSKKHVNLTVETKRCNEKSTHYRLHLSAHSFSLFKTRHLQIQNQENKFCKRQSIKLSQPSKYSCVQPRGERGGKARRYNGPKEKKLCRRQLVKIVLFS